MLHCNRRIGARERRQLIPHVRFQVPFLGPESQLKSGFACAGLPCSALARTANCNDGAMRAVLVGCLSLLPHFGSSPSELHLASRLSNKRHCLRQRATHEHDDWKSTTERTLSAPGGCFTVRVTLALFTIALVSPRFHLIFHHFVATLHCRCLLRSAFK